MTTPKDYKEAANIWIDSARTLLEKHRRSHDALNLTPCMCTVCISARFLIEHVPMLEPPASLPGTQSVDPRLTGFRDARGGLPK